MKLLARSLCGLLVSPFLISSAFAGECDAFFVSEHYQSKQSIIKFWQYENDQWGDPIEVDRSEKKWSFSPTMSFNQSEELVFLWMGADKNEFQIYSRVLSSEGIWKSPATKVTNSPGQKSGPKLFLGLDDSLYAAWLSDESGNDEVFLATIGKDLKINTIEGLYEANSVPDIDPSFEYQASELGDLELLFSWKQLSIESSSYVEQSTVLQTDSINPEYQTQANSCEEAYRSIDLPDGATKGSFYFPSRFAQPYAYIKER